MSEQIPERSWAGALEFVGSGATAVGGLAIFAAVVGWRTSGAYYTEIGAQWVVPLLSTAQRLAAAETQILWYSITFLLSMAWLLEHASDTSRIRRVYNSLFAVTLVSGCLFYGIGALGVQFPRTQTWAGLIGAASWGATASMTVAGWAVNTTIRPRHQRSWLVWSIYSVVLAGFIWIPAMSGVRQAKQDSARDLTSLPTVHSGSDDGDWHLLLVLDSNAILLKVPAQPGRGVLRVVPITTLAEIQAEAR